jgi:hypothetical protein
MVDRQQTVGHGINVCLCVLCLCGEISGVSFDISEDGNGWILRTRSFD